MMSNYRYMELKIDQKFKNLIPPLSAEEYSQLEENLLREGCLAPLCVWNGTIIDGHNRYEICLRNEIPFKIRHMELNDGNDVVAWICANQIGRRNMSEETRRYLIGKRYESEKMVGITNVAEKDQCSIGDGVRPEMWGKPPSETTHIKTARRLGGEYHLAFSTVEKYGAYSRAIDALSTKDDELTPKILSGQTKISHENVIKLSRLSTQELRRISKEIIRNDRNFVGYAAARREEVGKCKVAKAKKPQIFKVNIKDMPAFDPDAEISSLALTIPSWISSIDRTKATTVLELVSDEAKDKLVTMLNRLKEAVAGMLCSIKE